MVQVKKFLYSIFKIKWFLWIVFPSFIYANQILPQFFSDKTGRVYNENDFYYEIIAQSCSVNHQETFHIDPSKGKLKKGINQVEYLVSQENTGISHYFPIPTERVLSLRYNFDSLNQGQIKFPIDKDVPSFAKTIVIYVRGDSPLDKLTFVIEEDGIKRFYSYPAFRIFYGLYAFPLNDNQNITHRVLKEVIVTHKHEFLPKKDIVLSLGEIHFVSFKAKETGLVDNHTPFFNPIDLNQFSKTQILKGPDNITYGANNLILWPYKQSLLLNVTTQNPFMLEIYGVLQARINKAFLLRLRVPYKNRDLCIKVDLPLNLIKYSKQNYNNTSVILHGLKFLPISEGSLKSEPNFMTLNTLFLKREYSQ